MSCLLYCIFDCRADFNESHSERSEESQNRGQKVICTNRFFTSFRMTRGETLSTNTTRCLPCDLVGVKGQPVVVVRTNGLGAALSRFTDINPSLTPPPETGWGIKPILSLPIRGGELKGGEIALLQVYLKVIESFHRRATVIPMRYGSLVEDESWVVRHLKEQRAHYAKLLEELEDCVEMGIRILNPDSEISLSEEPPPLRSRGGQRGDQSVFSTSHPLNPGRAFMTARKAHYELIERAVRDKHGIIERCRSAFAGLFIKCKVEMPTFHTPLLSLYYLVPRDFLGDFCRTFRQISAKESSKLLLSGPWPPYNFVQSDHPQNADTVP